MNEIILFRGKITTSISSNSSFYYYFAILKGESRPTTQGSQNVLKHLPQKNRTQHVVHNHYVEHRDARKKMERSGNSIVQL